MDYNIELATEKDIDKILKIYDSLKGKDGCTWNEDYPSVIEVSGDINKQCLFKVVSHDEIIAVVSASKDDELNGLSFFNKNILEPCYLARLAVKTEYQNKGIAKYLLNFIEKYVLKKGFDGIRFLVSKTNPHAIAVYNKMNYVCCGECNKYERDWFCYEKKLVKV